MIVDLKKTQRIEKKEYDRHGRPILNPIVLNEKRRIESISPANRTTKDKMRLNKIKRDGDHCRAQNKFKLCSNNPEPIVELEDLNNAAELKTEAQAHQVINSIYSGKLPIEAMNEAGISPKSFYRFLRRGENTVLRSEFLNAREVFAEYCLFKRQLLEEQLLRGVIDSSTYTTLAADYKYLAAKFHPAAYGDKLKLETDVKHTARLEVSQTRVKALNALLSGNLLENQTVTADYEVLDG